MSRMAAALLLASPAPAVAADTAVTAEQAMENYRAAFQPAHPSRCQFGEDEEDIVVCGRRPGQYPRLPLPAAPVAGARIRGEPPSGTSAFSGHGCIRLCPQPLKIDIFKAAKAIAKGADRLIHGE